MAKAGKATGGKPAHASYQKRGAVYAKQMKMPGQKPKKAKKAY